MSDSLEPAGLPGQDTPVVPQGKPAGSKVKRGCLIGCLLLITIVLVSIGGCYGFMSYMFAKLRPHAAAAAKTKFEKAVEENRVPDADLPVYADLVDISQKPESSFYAIVTCAALVVYDLDDGEVSEEERKDATAARDFLRDNPGVSMARISVFFGDHPAIQKKVENISRSSTIMPAPGGAQ
ncbi:MAG: hypothetical protein AMXMBFR84_50560 [Candidatus Hydrogenedentota bacterium]